MPAQIITVTPSKGNGTKIDWTMCHTAPGKTEVCSPKNVYPPITVGHNSGSNAGAQVFTVTINDVNKLGINFSSDPLWIQANSKPKSHVIDAQIFDVTPNPTKLVFKDKNDGGPVTLVYQLNFVGADQKPVTSIDPDIKNGGTTVVGGDSQAMTVVLVVGLAVLAAALWFGFRAIRRNTERNSGGRP